MTYEKPENHDIIIYQKHHDGFTLVELLVVIAIISVLAGMLMPALENAIGSARSIKCQSNQRHISLAMAMYADENNDYFPYWLVGYVGGSPKHQNFASHLIHTGILQPAASIYDDSVLNCPDFTRDGSNFNINNGEFWTSYMINRSVCGYVSVLGSPPYTFNPPAIRRSNLSSPGNTMIMGDAALNRSSSDFVLTATYYYQPYMIGGLCWNDQYVSLNDFVGRSHDSMPNGAFCDGHVETHPWPWKKYWP